MNFKKLTPEIINNKIILIRLDMNVSLIDGEILENTRIKESIPTLDFLLKNNAKRIHILTHCGRPKGQKDPKFSTKFILPELEKLWSDYAQKNIEIEFRKNYTAGKEKIQLHENARFYPGEKNNDPDLAQEIVKETNSEIFVLDGFAVAHRAQASVIGPAKFLDAYPGFLMEKEIKNLSPFLTDKKIKGLTILVSGAKMETKVSVLKKFAKIAENVLVGGAIANTFLAAKNLDIGESLYEKNEINNAIEVINLMKKNNTNFLLPVDSVCSENLESENCENIDVNNIRGKNKIFDIGSKTIEKYKNILKNSDIIIWNGPVGVFEYKNFEQGTRIILQTIADQKSAKTILGGGDTLEALKKFDVKKSNFTHVSTGGGSMLEFLEGKNLPGIEIFKK